MLQKNLRAISENLAVYVDSPMRDPFLRCKHPSCRNGHIMEIQVENADEDVVMHGWFCKAHFMEMLRKEMPRISEEDEIELAGLFGQNVIDVALDRKGLQALEKLFAEAKAKPIIPPDAAAKKAEAPPAADAA